jgi:ADP-dependent NAD(P)H-hydrate dehydratase / NAD(P)H-hydrate epimerase
MNMPNPLQRVTPRNGPWPLHLAANARAIEQSALHSAPPHTLMAAAGLGVARLALALAPHAQRVQVFVGPGNNGGDGSVAARHLHQAGKSVTLNLCADVNHLPADATHALREAVAAGVAVREGLDGSAHDLAIDALLGLGGNRAPSGQIAAAIACMNNSSPRILAVDLPSGLCGDTGQSLGEAAVRASATLALLTLKPGCFTAQGRDHAGEVWFDSLGVLPNAMPQAWLNSRPARAARAHASHKGSYGDVAVVGGAPGMTGAAWLAARAALAAGAGRVYCSPLDENTALLDPVAPELMGRSAWWRSPPDLLRQTTVVCGCGGGEAVRAALPPLLSYARRLVLDADALNAIAGDSALQALMRQRAGRGTMTVLTPHPLEAARLLHTSTAQVQADRLQAAQALADAFGVTVLLKGSGSVIAAPQQALHINSTGNAALASPGTGDVLAGWLAGLWAQSPNAPAADIASLAAWWHGHAADAWRLEGHIGPLRASALVRALAELR